MHVKQELSIPEKKERTFLPGDFTITTWDLLLPWFTNLRDRPLRNVAELERWLLDLSELEGVYMESQAWRYIKMTGDTSNAEYEKSFNYFASEISPQAAPYFNEFNKKLAASPYAAELEESTYAIFLRSVKKQIEIYREENIPLLTEIDVLSQEYGKILGGMSVVIREEEMTFQKASALMKNTDRVLREEAFHKIRNKRLEAKETLNTLFDQLLALRHQVALKAGFENFRDYAFAAYGRFDYTAADCFKFHQAVAKAVVPVVAAFDRKRKQQLGLDKLRPWDTEVDVTGLPPLQPFVNSSELIDKTIACFNQIHPDFGGYISIMHKMGHFDLDSRKSKAPGGYNYPLPESGVPFIFMNSVGSVRDLVTMVHEGGHAIHSFLCTDLPLNDTKNVPAEFSELASMGMELISMEHWDVFFDTPEDLKRAKLEQLEKVVDALPWIAQIDKFQHWIYEHPKHSVEERRQAWMGLSAEFRSQVVDWTGLEAGSGYDWQRQLHLFEVPFYYIEYAFAQLGAIALWRNYKSNPQETIASYRKALGLGYTRSIGTLYQAAGIRFDFSEAYVSELVQFVLDEIGQLE